MKNRVVLITGGSRGIGYAAAKKFLEEGETVILTARNKEAGEKAISSLGYNKNLYFHLLDVSSDESVLTLQKYTHEKFGRVDVLINNAAINYDTWQNTLSADMNDILDTINVNVLGAWRMINAFVAMMKSSDYGRIINMSSGLGAFDDMGSGTPAYSISKAALNALTVKVANNLHGSNILINSLCPGWVRTDMGGKSATRSPDEAASDIYELSNNDKLQGKFVRYGKVIKF